MKRREVSTRSFEHIATARDGIQPLRLIDTGCGDVALSRTAIWENSCGKPVWTNCRSSGTFLQETWRSSVPVRSLKQKNTITAQIFMCFQSSNRALPVCGRFQAEMIWIILNALILMFTTSATGVCGLIISFFSKPSSTFWRGGGRIK